MYWTESNRVARVPLDDTTAVETVYSPLNQGTGITIDYLTATLIWGSNQTLHTSNLDGTNVQELLPTNDARSPFQILVTGDRLYWTSIDSDGLNVVTLSGAAEPPIFLSFEGFDNIVSSQGLTAIDENKRPDSGELYRE